MIIMSISCSTPTTPTQTANRITTSSAPVASKAITLKLVTFFSKSAGTTSAETGQMIVDKVKERSNGELIINWVGGPETIATADQPAAVRDGVIDFHIGPMSFYEQLLPEISVSNLSRFTPMEERQNGVYNHWVKTHEKMNVRYLGIPHSPGQYFLFMNREIKNPKADFKGLKMRSNNTFNPFLKALGAVPATVKQDEVFGAIQTGVVDGAGWVPDSFVEQKAYEVTKYWIDYGFYRVSSAALLNLRTWNSLPQNLQEVLDKVCGEVEAKRWADMRVQDAEYISKFKAEGMKPLTFSPEDAKWYVDLAYNSKWEDAKGKIGEQEYNTIKSLLVKK